MADTSGMAEIRGINIDKLAKGFADEANVMKKYVTVTPTEAREIRWYQKTSGFLDTTDTTGLSLSRMGTDQLAMPEVMEQSWTRRTSYVRKYFIESPTISSEDIKDSDIDVLATNVRDIVRGVARQVDQRIIMMLTNAAEETPTTPLTDTSTYGAVQTAASTDEWDQVATAKPITDILNAKQKIRAEGYDPEGCMMGMNSIEHKLLLAYLIETKGSSIPNWSSTKLDSGVVMNLLGTNIVVSENFTTDWVTLWVPSRSLTWKSFMPITSVVMDEPGIGKKIRCWEEGEALLTDRNSVFVISNTGVQ